MTWVCHAVEFYNIQRVPQNGCVTFLKTPLFSSPFKCWAWGDLVRGCPMLGGRGLAKCSVLDPVLYWLTRVVLFKNNSVGVLHKQKNTVCISLPVFMSSPPSQRSSNALRAAPVMELCCAHTHTHSPRHPLLYCTMPFCYITHMSWTHTPETEWNTLSPKQEFNICT